MLFFLVERMDILEAFVQRAWGVIALCLLLQALLCFDSPITSSSYLELLTAGVQVRKSHRRYVGLALLSSSSVLSG